MSSCPPTQPLWSLTLQIIPISTHPSREHWEHWMLLIFQFTFLLQRHAIATATVVSQNVLAATTFNMHFCYILSGWEGSAPDGGVFYDACLHDLDIPPGKYYLTDAIPSMMLLWCHSVVFSITSGSGKAVLIT